MIKRNMFQIMIWDRRKIVSEQVDFQPVLLGTDFNCYGMARSFYEAYGIKSIAFGVTKLASTRYTKLVDVRIVPGFNENPGFVETLAAFAKTMDPNKKYLLLSCGDGYTDLISEHLDELKQWFVVPYVGADLFERLGNKEGFYAAAEEFGLPYPKTKLISREMVESGEPIDLPFDFPVALKASDSIAWLDVHFEGRKKAFILDTRAEFDALLPKIYAAGYQGNMICQDFIPGDDSNMRVVNAYVDSDHNVRMICLGHPLLEDPEPSAVGNYMVILPEKNDQIYQTIKKFLEDIKYVGFADFDLKYDVRDGQYKVFEINLRQGRSSYYCTLNGYNLAKYVVEDAIYHRPFTETEYADGDQLWLSVPKKIFYKYAKDNEYKQRAIKLLKAGQYGTTAFDKQDSWKQRALMHYAFHLMNAKYKQFFVQR